MMSSAIAQNSATTPNNADLKARCNQLISMYDCYMVLAAVKIQTARAITRASPPASIAQEDSYAQGVAEMETLLKQKHFDVPPPTTGVAQQPSR